MQLLQCNSCNVTVLFNSLNEASISRRGDGKAKSDLSDILNRFRKVDERNEKLPIFVADGYSTMPLSSGYEVLAELTESGLKEQVRLLKDSNVLQYEKIDINPLWTEFFFFIVFSGHNLR